MCLKDQEVISSAAIPSGLKRDIRQENELLKSFQSASTPSWEKGGGICKELELWLKTQYARCC